MTSELIEKVDIAISKRIVEELSEITKPVFNQLVDKAYIRKNGGSEDQALNDLFIHIMKHMKAGRLPDDTFTDENIKDITGPFRSVIDKKREVILNMLTKNTKGV